MTRQLARWELDGVNGAVVVVDVIRAFTTAAYAFASGAAEIYLVGTVDEALAFKAAQPGSLAMGEERGLRPNGFDFPNSPAKVRAADLDGRTLVQRTSAGTQGVVRAVDASRLWAASLVVASATARATLALGPDHTDPRDIELAAAVDAFDFAMEVERTDLGLRLSTSALGSPLGLSR